MKKHLWTVLFSVCLFSFTLYVLLDTFVITRVYRTDTTIIDVSSYQNTLPSDMETGEGSAVVFADDSAVSVHVGAGKESGGSGVSVSKRAAGPGKKKPPAVSASSDETGAKTASATNTVSDNYYDDGQIKIALQTYEVSDTVIYVADIQLASVEYLKTAFAYDIYGKNVTAKTSEIASAHNAILAINGDYYGAQEKGYVIRNGVVYRDNQAFSFGPALVTDGEIAVDKNTEVGRAKASNPRTAIGIIDDLHYIFVVSDGRTDESEGLSLYELADFMRQLGSQTAYNLDGGGSSTMVFNGKVVNNPTTNGSTIKERSISDIIYIG